MTNTKPEALRLAEWLETSPYHHDKIVAAELRRLHEVNAELLEALKDVMDRLVDKNEMDESAINARAAIAKAEGWYENEP
jgi:hypothetical protein